MRSIMVTNAWTLFTKEKPKKQMHEFCLMQKIQHNHVLQIRTFTKNKRTYIPIWFNKKTTKPPVNTIRPKTTPAAAANHPPWASYLRLRKICKTPWNVCTLCLYRLFHKSLSHCFTSNALRSWVFKVVWLVNMIKELWVINIPMHRKLSYATINGSNPDSWSQYRSYCWSTSHIVSHHKVLHEYHKSSEEHLEDLYDI